MPQYIEVIQFSYLWALKHAHITEVIAAASRTSDEPFFAGYGHVVFRRDGDKLQVHDANFDSSD